MHNFCLLNIKRPVLSSVFSLLLVVFGLYTFFQISTRELPKNLQPPVVEIRTNYTGASPSIISSEISDIEANKILLGQMLSVCYAVDRNHITMKQKIDMLGYALNLHERAHGNKQTIEEDMMNSIGKVLDIFPDCFPEVKKKK